MSSTATQRSLLLALSGVSLAALFIWYLQSKKSRRSPSIEDVKKNIEEKAVDNSKEKERSISTKREQSSDKTENKVVEKSEEKEPSQTCALVSNKQLNAGPPKMTTALETGPVSQVDPSAIPMVNGIAKEAEEIVAEVKIGLLNAEATKEEQCQIKEEDQKQRQTKEEEETREEQSVEEAAADLQQQLVLDVSHQAEPEAFSWSDEMERSYEESRKKEEEERQQQESGAVNGSGDYTTSDSPGLASQNSEDLIIVEPSLMPPHLCS
ncbi:hypothetical protein Aduo_010383 [Ancylostoma duodenale]